MPLATTVFDPAEHLGNPESQAFFLADAFESGDAGYIAHALGILARAQGMTKVAAEAGVTREGLYKSLSADGDPRLSTVIGVARSLGLKLTAQTA